MVEEVSQSRLTGLVDTYSGQLKELRKRIRGVEGGAQVLTARQVRQIYGLSLPNDSWMLKTAPGGEGGYTLSLITPQKWEVADTGMLQSPEGKTGTPADFEIPEPQAMQQLRQARSKAGGQEEIDPGDLTAGLVNTYGPAWVLTNEEWAAAGHTGDRYEGTFEQWKDAFEKAHPTQTFEDYLDANRYYGPLPKAPPDAPAVQEYDEEGNPIPWSPPPSEYDIFIRAVAERRKEMNKRFEVGDLFKPIFPTGPGGDMDNIRAWARRHPEEAMNAFAEAGRTPETEVAALVLYGTLTEDDKRLLFGEPEPLPEGVGREVGFEPTRELEIEPLPPLEPRRSPEEIEAELQDVISRRQAMSRQEGKAFEIFGTVFAPSEVKAALETAQADPESFLAEIRKRGRTPETEALLKAMFTQPDGETILESDLAEIFEPEREQQDLVGQVVEVFGESNAQGLLRMLREEPDKFVGEFQRLRLSEESDQLLRTLMPSVTADGMAVIYDPQGFIESISREGATPGNIQRLRAAFPALNPSGTGAAGDIELGLSDDEIKEMLRTPATINRTLGDMGAKAIQQFLKQGQGTQAQAALEIIARPLDKYVDRPFEVALLTNRASFGNTEADKALLAKFDAAKVKYGAGAFFSDEMSEAVKEYESKLIGASKTTVSIVTDWLNPAYFIPIGGSFGLMAKFTSKIPLIGKAMKATAAAVQLAELEAGAPLRFAGKKTLQGFEAVGKRLDDKMTQQLIERSAALIDGSAIAGNEELLSGLIIDNWQRRGLLALAKVPAFGKVLSGTLGYRILVSRESETVKDVVGRGAVIYNEIARQGINAARGKRLEFEGLLHDSANYFGFGEMKTRNVTLRAFSPKMKARLLPEFASEARIAGTVEHVFTHPEMYNFDGLEQGLKLIQRVQETNAIMLKMLRAEGIEPKHVVEDWLHRKVLGVRTPEGVVTENKKVTDFMKARRMETMADGIEAGVIYDHNVENAVAEYIQSAYRKVASARLKAYTEKYAVDVRQRLLERSPNLFEKMTLGEGKIPAKEWIQDAQGQWWKPKKVAAQEHLTRASNFNKQIWRAIRGEGPPEQALQAIEREFPELGAKFRAIVKPESIPGKQTVASLIEDVAKAAENPAQVDIFGYPVGPHAAPTPSPTIPTAAAKASLPERLQRIESELQADIKIARKRISQTPEATPFNPADDVDFARAALTDAERLLAKNQTLIGKVEKGIAVADEEIAALSDKVTSLKDYIKFTESLTPARRAKLRELSKEVKALLPERRAAFKEAKGELAEAREKAAQPTITEAFVMEPAAARGKIWSQEFADTFKQFFGQEKGVPGLSIVADVNGIIRNSEASLDFSANMIQGMVPWGLAHATMLSNPKVGAQLVGAWYKSLAYNVGSFINPRMMAKYIEKNKGLVDKRRYFGGTIGDTGYLGLEKEIGGGVGEKWQLWSRKIPSQPYQRAEAAFAASSEYIRDEFWKILSQRATAQGKEFELARFLDRITGIFDSKTAGLPLTTRQLEQSFTWFAPSYTRASLSVVADIFRGGMTGAEVRKALGGMLGAGAAHYTAVQYGLSTLQGMGPEDAWDTVLEGFGVKEDPITHEVEWKPTGNFMTIKIGDQHFGFGGFYYGLLRLTGNLMAIAKGDNEPVNLVSILKDGELNRDNPFVYWWYTRSAPLTGFISDMTRHRDFLGYPIETPQDYAKYIGTMFEPIWMEQGLNWMVPGLARDSEIPEGVAEKALVPLGELFGLRVFPDSAWADFYKKASEYITHIPEKDLDKKQIEAWQAGKLGWQQLDHRQKVDLFNRYDDLLDLYSIAQADSAVRDSSVWQDWTTQRTEEKKTYYGGLDRLTEQLRRGVIDIKEYRKRGGDAGQQYGAAIDSMPKAPAYNEIYAYLEAKNEKGLKYEFDRDVMQAEYEAKILYAEDLEVEGIYDWEERDNRVDALIEKWGQPLYDKMLATLAEEKRQAGLNPVWIRKGEDSEKLSRTYWRIDPEDSKAKAEYRMKNPEDDARLALWGYGGKVQTKEAYDLVVKWAKELQLPVATALKGLPPSKLADNYFAYNKLDGMEAKWFRQEHPDYDAWLVESTGLKPISEQKVTPRRIKGFEDEYEKLPEGEARLDYRRANAEYDAYLVEEKGYSPVKPKAAAPVTPAKKTKQEQPQKKILIPK